MNSGITIIYNLAFLVTFGSHITFIVSIGFTMKRFLSNNQGEFITIRPECWPEKIDQSLRDFRLIISIFSV